MVMEVRCSITNSQVKLMIVHVTLSYVLLLKEGGILAFVGSILVYAEQILLAHEYCNLC